MKMKILKLMRRVSGVRWKHLKLMNGNKNRINFSCISSNRIEIITFTFSVDQEDGFLYCAGKSYPLIIINVKSYPIMPNGKSYPIIPNDN